MQTDVAITYVNHWIIDIGLATIAAIVGKPTVIALTHDDLEAAANHLKGLYCNHAAVRNYLSVIFTNSHFVQASMNSTDREAYANHVLFAFNQDRPYEGEGARCPFFPARAAIFTAFRQHIPLLNGEGISNFSAAGRAGLPISGLALLAAHAMPMGCFKTGKLLALFHQVSSSLDESPGRMTTVLARNAWRQNNGDISALGASDTNGKLPSRGGSARTNYVSVIMAAEEGSRERDVNIDNVTGYFFTNYGPEPRIELVRLDHTVLRFIQAARLDAPAAWQRAIRGAWQVEKGERLDQISDVSTRRNFLYETLFELPAKPIAFLRRLRHGNRWALIAIFLKEVMRMEAERIDTYRRLGDTLFEYVRQYENQPLSFYVKFSRAKAYIALRSIIRTAAEKMYRATAEAPLFSYDDFILAFEHPSEAYSQWKLARDLISIRLLERLHELKVDLSELPDFEDEDEKEN
jgi:CRISPR-associated protein Cst1